MMAPVQRRPMSSIAAWKRGQSAGSVSDTRAMPWRIPLLAREFQSGCFTSSRYSKYSHTRKESIMNFGFLIARLVLGLLMAGHGAQKLFGWFGGYGLEAVSGFFEGLGFRPG